MKYERRADRLCDPGSTGVVANHEVRTGRQIRSCLCVLLLAGLSACKESVPEDKSAEGEVVTKVLPPMPVPDMADVLEITQRSIIGITYPKRIERYPGLARNLHAYSDTVRGELEAALQDEEVQVVPYELSLAFTYAIETPHLVVVAVDGSLYTGGAESEPRVKRFVWLAGEERLLSGSDLITDPAGWDVVRNLWLQRLNDAADASQGASSILAPEGPDTDDPGRWPFVPQLDERGRLAGLSFVVPGAAVGSTLEVPVETLRPYMDPARIAQLEPVRPGKEREGRLR